MPRSERLELRLTGAEKAVWDAAAVQAGLSLSEYVRARVNAGIAARAERTPVPKTPIAAPTERPVLPPSPLPTAAERPPVATTAPQPPVVPTHPLAALFPVWRNGLCPDCTRRGSPCCVPCRVRNGLAI